MEKLVEPRNSGTLENPRDGSRKWPHTFHMSPAVVPHMEQPFSIVRNLGRDFLENLRFANGQLLKTVKQLFRVTVKLIMEQTEIGGLTTIESKEPTWRSTTSLRDTAFEITNAKTYVFADSAFCPGSISDEPIEAWKNRIKWYLENRYQKI